MRVRERAKLAVLPSFSPLLCEGREKKEKENTRAWARNALSFSFCSLSFSFLLFSLSMDHQSPFVLTKGTRPVGGFGRGLRSCSFTSAGNKEGKSSPPSHRCRYRSSHCSHCGSSFTASCREIDIVDIPSMLPLLSLLALPVLVGRLFFLSFYCNSKEHVASTLRRNPSRHPMGLWLRYAAV